VYNLKKYIDEMNPKHYLTHIDAVPDNFLIDDQQNIRLIDWEYAGMQDVHVDLAMFSIYSGYEKNEIDNLIDIYFEKNCPIEVRYKIYAYVAICGFLWSNWCEYKKKLGVEFGEYSLMQYRYAKVYSKIALEYFDKGDE
ncbi:MAG: phosphotransferase, partial [Anaeroplasmataceae bacterium]|nr:phosphotransferase [Anaeroplasmataceae bacterium]